MKKKRNDPKRDDGIVSWHAPSGRHLARNPTKPFRAGVAEHGGREALDTQTTTIDSVFRCDLRPSAVQRTILESLFSGPVFLKSLVLNAERKPQTPHDASMFLLRHHRELQPYLSTGDRNESVDMLKNLIVQWSASVSRLIEIEFPGDCSISASNEIFFPVHGLGTIAVQNPGRLADARQGSRYKQSFAIVRSSLGYLVEIVFVRRHSIECTLVERPPVAQSKPRDAVRVTPKPKDTPRAKSVEERLMYGDFCKLFSQRRMMADHVARSFTKPDFNALEGRQLMGGLPSLGKRR